MFFKTYGILGQNARNLNYIKGYNNSVSKNLADSKSKTKEFLTEKGVSIAETLLTIESYDDLKGDFLQDLALPFVIKPNSGYGGKGIIILESKDEDGNYISNSGKIYSIKSLKSHCKDILDGFFSLSGYRDSIIIEKKILLDHKIELLGKFGLPDIRVLVFNKVPVMAMLRVPTSESSGKANLHAGACGVGIDIGSGKLTYITRKSKIIKSIPDIGDVRGIKIPKWEEILTLAVKVQTITNIGYVGCDIVLDDNKGPLLLEMNIRPGLEVQVANMAPLKDRLERVSGVNINSIEKGVRLGRDLFSGDIEEKIKNITGKNVIGLKEYITIYYNDKKYKYLTNINISDLSSYIDKEFLKNILKIDLEDKNEIKLKFDLFGEVRVIRFIIKEDLGVNISLGKIGLKGFLLDPFKYRKGEMPTSSEIDFLKSKNIAIRNNYEEILNSIDKKLISIDKKLILLKHIRPINITEEKEKFISSSGKYIPKFKYDEFKLNLISIEKQVEAIDIPDIPLSIIYNGKKQEIKNKIQLLNSFKTKNYKDYTSYSKKLYGNIIKENLELSMKKLENMNEKIKKEEDYISFEEVKSYINKFNHIYGIKISLKKMYGSSRFYMKGNVLFFREDALVGKKELRAIVAHEIEGHYLRKINGTKLKYSIFSHGTAGYLSTEEGVAVYNQNRFLNESSRKYYSIYERYFFVNYALKNNYSKLISKMLEFYSFDYEKVFNYVLRLKSGFEDISKDGCFVKDVVYLNGFLEVSDYLASGKPFKDLYLGKINISDLEYLKNSYFLNISYKDLKAPFSI